MSNTRIIVGASQSFDHWHHATCHNYSVTESRCSERGPFSGHISARAFGTLILSEISSSIPGRVEVVRGDREIRADPRDQFMLFLVYCGEVGFSQNGQTTRLRSGDMIIYDQARPFTMEFGGETREIMVSIPRPLMASRLPEAECFTARPVQSSSKLGALTATVVRQLSELEASLPEEIASRVGGSALDILAATLQAELSDGVGEAGRHDPRRARVKRYIIAHLEDPDMTIESIAAAQHLAPRTLHRLFAIEGTTPIRWLWEQRLSASYKALAEGRIRHVTDAALSFGFTDLSHYSRAFKKAFGHCPHTLVRR
jgi:AraC-like DNA-binding protein